MSSVHSSSGHAAASSSDVKAEIQVWDLPTRLFHWVLVVLVVSMFVTAQIPMMDLHMILGQGVLALVLFRLGWGIVGSSTSRFRSFVRSPWAGVAYLTEIRNGRRPLYSGHNPAGAWMIVALLLLLALQAVSGLFSNGRGFFFGPLASLVSRDVSDIISGFHEALSTVLEIFAIFHAGVALFYLFVLRENLILPLMTGGKSVALVPKGESPRMVSPLWALLLMILATLFVWGIVSLGR